jgi:hypothetical protein
VQPLCTVSLCTGRYVRGRYVRGRYVRPLCTGPLFTGCYMRTAMYSCYVEAALCMDRYVRAAMYDGLLHTSRYIRAAIIRGRYVRGRYIRAAMYRAAIYGLLHTSRYVRGRYIRTATYEPLCTGSLCTGPLYTSCYVPGRYIRTAIYKLLYTDCHIRAAMYGPLYAGAISGNYMRPLVQAAVCGCGPHIRAAINGPLLLYTGTRPQRIRCSGALADPPLASVALPEPKMGSFCNFDPDTASRFHLNSFCCRFRSRTPGARMVLVDELGV